MTHTETTRTPRRVPVEYRPDAGVRVRCRVFRRAALPHFQAPSGWGVARPAADREAVSVE